ncbi:MULTISPECIES: carbohydrate ABC transporter permease [Catenuloplanes]|uniref:Multiple sugar transport system permease protein n=1 Tax=Catenuloplanes niger TaxID=587534 RepID=A0AAE4CV34_9ACTN|nr:carbohydrate ABC transporter permease [Catenuloplanes niger]MDR7325062.1 multiple sugar transport system permease protein [Catenuloplanes niger]
MRRLRSVAWHAGAVLLLIVVLYPVVWMISSSFKDSRDIIGDLDLLPAPPTGRNYATAVEGVAGISVWRLFGNSLLLAVLSVIGTVVSSTLAAYAFARVRFRGRGLLFALMISTLLLPFHVLIIPQYIVFQRLDLIDTYLPLLVGKFLAVEAFFVFLLVQFMRTLPYELDESARIDGAGHGRIFWNIVLPLSRPALITTSIFTFIWTWNDFFGPLIYLSTPDRYPLPLALQLYIDQTEATDYGALIAMSTLALLPVVLFFLVFQRFLIEGVATSGLKG